MMPLQSNSVQFSGFRDRFQKLIRRTPQHTPIEDTQLRAINLLKNTPTLSDLKGLWMADTIYFDKESQALTVQLVGLEPGRVACSYVFNQDGSVTKRRQSLSDAPEPINEQVPLLPKGSIPSALLTQKRREVIVDYQRYNVPLNGG